MLQAVALVATEQFDRVDETQVPAANKAYPEAQVVQVEVPIQLEQFEAVQLVVVVVTQEDVVVAPLLVTYEYPVAQAVQTYPVVVL